MCSVVYVFVYMVGIWCGLYMGCICCGVGTWYVWMCLGGMCLDDVCGICMLWCVYGMCIVYVRWCIEVWSVCCLYAVGVYIWAYT